MMTYADTFPRSASPKPLLSKTHIMTDSAGTFRSGRRGSRVPGFVGHCIPISNQWSFTMSTLAFDAMIWKLNGLFRDGTFCVFPAMATFPKPLLILLSSISVPLNS